VGHKRLYSLAILYVEHALAGKTN